MKTPPSATVCRRPPRKGRRPYQAIEKLSPAGKQLERITKIAYQQEGEEEKLEEPEAGETHGLTIGVEGTPWLYYEETLYPLSSSTLKKPSLLQPLTFSLTGEGAPGFAASPAGRFYIGQDVPGPTGQPVDVTSTWQTTPGSQELEEQLEGLDYQDTTASRSTRSTSPKTRSTNRTRSTSPTPRPKTARARALCRSSARKAS